MNKQMWEEYVEARYSDNISQKTKVLTKCMEQTEDPMLAASAKRDMGTIFLQQYQEQNEEESLEKAKKYLKEAADAGDEIGNQLYGVLLFNEGNMEAFDYLAEALKLGNIYSAYVLQDNLHMQEDFPLAMRIKVRIEQAVEEIVTEYEKLADQDAGAEFVLALIGLYDLGERVGLDRKQGMDHLEKAVRRGHERAVMMKENPVLLKPETMNQFEVPSAEELKKMDKRSLELEDPALTKRKKGIRKIVLLLLLVLVVCLFGKTIWSIATAAVTSVFHVLRPILSIAFLLVVAYFAYGDENVSSKKSEDAWNPIKEHHDNHDCRKMPNCIYDAGQNTWSKVRAYENVAVYRNYDYGEDEITYCDISSHYATGGKGDYHWY